MKHTLAFTDALALRAESTGGKGANLASLTRGDFPVPQGFFVVADAYRLWLDGCENWQEMVMRLPFDDAAALVPAAEKLRDRLREVPLPEALHIEIRERLAEFATGSCFAVRSSSTMEDLAQSAFAGQHDTFLNCHGEPQILTAIHRCFLSVWHDRVISYRYRQGFDPCAAQMAVVVQEMVRCDVAGVAFSINPISGDMNVALIEANHGMGESVVSGECDVDDWEVEKATGQILSRKIARKSVSTVCLEGGGVELIPLEEHLKDAPSLSDDQLAQVTDLLRRVEAWYRFPQDIEWGFCGNQLHLLQSRAITTIPPRWTRDESAERFPNAITPLTWDFVKKGFKRSMDHSFRMMGFPPFSGEWFGMHDHYIYGNQNAVDLYAKRMPFTLRSLHDLPTLIPKLREEYSWVQSLPVQWSRDLDFYLIRIGEFMAEPLDPKNLTELWDFVQEVQQHGSDYFLPNIAISITQGVLYKLLHFLLHAQFGADQGAQIMGDLLAFCETKTGAINKEFFELAQWVLRDDLLEKRLRVEGGSRALWESGELEKEHPGFHQRLLRFLRDHGHRETDFDPYHPTWISVPWIVLDQIRLILDASSEQTPSQRERELKIRSQSAEYQVFQRIPEELHFFLHEIIRLARLYTSLDDLEHYQTTRLALPLRKGLQKLGERLHLRDIIDEPMDVFFAHESEIEHAITRNHISEWKEFSQRVRDRKQSWLAAVEKTPSWEPHVADEFPASMAGTELRGTPGSPGMAQGPICTVHSPQDFASFPQGAILVARTTNPAWTPLFYAASGVITESGGPLSHGAVTAREMRIPAVMSVRACLSQLRDGEIVRIDGARGIVTRVE
ncbi:MAG: PEP/pyruvate-binding domain-containing protein [Akkermansiaceae bacterium]